MKIFGKTQGDKPRRKIKGKRWKMLYSHPNSHNIFSQPDVEFPHQIFFFFSKMKTLSLSLSLSLILLLFSSSRQLQTETVTERARAGRDLGLSRPERPGIWPFAGRDLVVPRPERPEFGYSGRGRARSGGRR
jgi:hypothetical protein